MKGHWHQHLAQSAIDMSGEGGYAAPYVGDTYDSYPAATAAGGIMSGPAAEALLHSSGVDSINHQQQRIATLDVDTDNGFTPNYLTYSYSHTGTTTPIHKSLLL